MRVIFDKTELSDAIDRVQRAAQAKITSNTNNGYFIATENGKVELQANDYTIGIKTSCPAMIEEEGIIVIAASQLQRKSMWSSKRMVYCTRWKSRSQPIRICEK